MTTENAPLLTDEQVRRVILGSLAARSPQSTEQIERAVEKVKEMVVSAALLELVLAGRASVVVDDDGEARFAELETA